MVKTQEALKLALEALDLAKRSHGVMLLSDPLQEAWKAYRVDDTLRNAITAIREALAEQQSGIKQVIELYDSPEQPACKYPNCPYPCPDLPDCRDAEQPASKPWVGLTEQEENELWEGTDSDWELMKRTEAKLREKNSG